MQRFACRRHCLLRQQLAPATGLITSPGVMLSAVMQLGLWARMLPANELECAGEPSASAYPVQGAAPADYTPCLHHWSWLS